MKGEKKLVVIAVLLVLLLLITGSYAWLRVSKTSDKINVITTGGLSLRLDNESADGINLIKELPKSYAQGLVNMEYTFELVNDGESECGYVITLNDLSKYISDSGVETVINSSNRLNDNLIRIMLLKDGESPAPSKTRLLSEGSGRVLDSGVIEPNGKVIKYSLRMWVDSKAGNDHSEASVMKKVFNGQITVDATLTD